MDLQYLPYDHRNIGSPVKISDFVWVAGNVTILPGVTIGEGAVIGAGSVVTKDIPPLAIAVGNPAEVRRWRDEEIYTKLKNEDMVLLKYESEGLVKQVTQMEGK
ncbi:acyltransferase [Alicyclobacillus dauci]|uniref:acyltransferase n=1 Tax=Alicyclobacillus dauci TaxID=1475485 RepID=UPI00389904AD